MQIPKSTIAVPALPDPFVPRRGLLAALVGDDPADERVTLVCTPEEDGTAHRGGAGFERRLLR